jgi:CelD/BcsL family acetyltransferase involved in cellulose biosynthesis
MLHVANLSSHIHMEVNVETSFDFLSDEYRRLYQRSDATAFQAPLWLDKIHRHLVPNLSARQFTITIRNPTDQSLIAVFPLVKQRAMGITIVQPADFGVCDYNAIVASDEILECIAHKTNIVDQLHDLVHSGSLFLFRKVRDDGFDITRIFPGLTASPCENAAYHSEINQGIEHWEREVLGKKMLKDLRRKTRQLNELHGDATVEIVKSEDQIRQALTFIREIRNERFESDLTKCPTYFAFYLDYATQAAQAGEADVYVKYIDGKPAAALFCLTGDGGFHAIMIAADITNYNKFSLGVQVMYDAIKMQFENGITLFDMCLGQTGFKNGFRAEPTQLCNFTASSNIAGAAVSAIYANSKPLKNMARKLVPDLH